jgi:two-component sensor histidine kinase
MRKSSFFVLLFCFIAFNEGFSQPPTPISNYTYHPPSTDKQSWQWLNLWLSASYFTATQGQVPDSSLIYVSRSLGLSRLTAMADDIDDPELLAQSEWFDQREPNKGVRLLSQATGKKHLKLLLLLGSYYAFQINRTPQSKDSVQKYLRKAIDESKTLNEQKLGRSALCLLVKLYTMLGDEINRKSVFDRLINDCHSAGDKITEARTLLFRGLYEGLAENIERTQTVVTDLLETRIRYLEKASEVYQQLNDKEGEILALTNKGYFNMVLERYDDVYPIFQKVLELENSIGYPYTHYTTDMLAMISSAQNKFGEPLKYCLETVRTAESVRDSIGWATFYARLGLLYLTDGQRDEDCLKALTKALDRFVMAKDPAVYQTLYNIVSVMVKKSGREKEALNLVLSVSDKVPARDASDSIFSCITHAYGYVHLKQYKLAEKFALKADSIQKTAAYQPSNGSYEKGMINTTLSSVYFVAGEYAKAKKYIMLDLNDSLRPSTLLNDMETYKQLIYIDSVFGDAESGVKHYNQYVQLVDSNFRASKIRQAEELQVMYQTKEKEDQIALLNQQAKLEQANLKQATLLRKVTIAGIIITLIIAGLLYRQSRIRKRNNTVVTRQNKQLQHLLTEKEWLLKEIHHRVKNNLQTVVSLLESQSAYLNSKEALLAIQDSQNRVHAMSLIHQKLYQADNVASINMAVYLPELVNYLRDSFSVQKKIKLDLQIIPIELDVSQAIPIGLILNEAITNSIKYAFTDQSVNNTITILMKQASDKRVELSVADNGKGLPQSLSTDPDHGLGLKLMKGLTEDIEGSFSIVTGHGTNITISFMANTPLYKFHEIKLPYETQQTA